MGGSPVPSSLRRPSPALSRTHLHTRGWCKGKQLPCRSLHPGRSFSSHGQSQQTVPALSEAAPEPLTSLFYLLYPDVLSSAHVISPFEFLRLFLSCARLNPPAPVFSTLSAVHDCLSSASPSCLYHYIRWNIPLNPSSDNSHLLDFQILFADYILYILTQSRQTINQKNLTQSL